jgi:microcompartment protein CcmK/EutM
MILCKVLGTAVSTRKDAQLQGAKMLMVVEVDARGEPLAKDTMIVIDAVGAGRGDVVLVATGSAANNTPQTANAPVDATAVAIVDTVSSGGQVLYSVGGSI